MTKHRTHTSSVSSAGSLMQDLPGTFPAIPEQPQSLSQAVYARKDEFVQPAHVRIKVGSWNVAAHKGTEKDLAGWFVEGKGIEEALTGVPVEHQELLHRAEIPPSNGKIIREEVSTQEQRYDKTQSSIPQGDEGTIVGNDEIGIYVLALQEVVDVNAVSEALRPYSDPAISKKWKDTLEASMPKGYMLIAEQQLIGLLLLVYASPSIGQEIGGISTTSVGTGIGGVMGNKGAVTARIVLGGTTRLVFVNCHLAAGADKAALERRNWDAAQIIQRTKFSPLQDVMDLNQTHGEQIGDEDFAFWAGDLNYRLEGIPADDVRRLLMLHTRNEYDLSHPSANKIENEIAQATKSVQRRSHDRGSMASSVSSVSTSSERGSMDSYDTAPTLVDEVAASDDPTSLQTTIDSLLPHDELRQQMKARKAFQDGWREGPITFLPTYKYDVGSVGVFDSSDKKRGPSFCDRILYRTRRDRLAYEAKIKDEEDARKLDAQMKDESGADEELLYDYDPATDGNENDYDENDDDDNADATVTTKSGFEDEMTLECYVTHQRVLSSDHKPMGAVFLLKYDRIVPDLKAKVHAEVVREQDKAENETRPTVTVVVDKHHPEGRDQNDNDPANFEGVWFGSVRWAQTRHRNLTIANTGQVQASFTLIERPTDSQQDAGVAPSWLNVKFDDQVLDNSSKTTKSVTLQPGETITISLEIRVLDIRLVRALNDGAKKLEDILVLRVDGGRDHFIPVRAKWNDTSLGHSIDKLIRIPEGGIRKFQGQSPESTAKKNLEESLSKLSLDSPVKFSAPRELFRLTETIEELTTRVVADWQMTAEDTNEAPWEKYAAWPFDETCWTERKTAMWSDALSTLCDALDTDRHLTESFPQRVPQNQRLYMLCNLLLIFLTDLPGGVLPQSQWQQIEQYMADVEKAKHKPSLEEQRTAIQEILVTCPPNNICFILLTTMLDRILKELPGSRSSSDKKPSALRRVAGIARLSNTSEDNDSPRIALTKCIAEASIHPLEESGDKIKPSQERRKAALMDLFLTTDR